MNYVYDIIVNLMDELYEFYEWDKDDNIEHIKKIPHYIINSKSLMEIKKNRVIFNKEFLNKIKNKTEIFSDNGMNIIPYSVLFTDDKTSIVLELDKSGEVIRKSSLLLDEEEEILEESDYNCSRIEYKIINKIPLKYNTRYETTIKDYINNEIDYLYNTDNTEKLKFLYNEWFNNINEDIKEVYSNLKNILNIPINEKHINFFNLIKLTNKERI